MLLNEARWLGHRLAELGPADLFPMLNVGSHTQKFRNHGQPWIDRYVFAPLRAADRLVVHTDIRAGEGVDLVGDLLEPAFREELRRRRFRSVLCSNLLEHVTDREPIAETIADVVEPGGYLLVTCPHRFPYHPDPIDTMYRPDVAELAALFSGTQIVRGEVVRCETLLGYLANRMWANPFGLVRNLVHRTGAKSRHESATKRSRLGVLAWLVRQFETTCLVLRKEPRS